MEEQSHRNPLDTSGSVYSIGTSLMMDALEKHLRNGDLDIDTVAINLATLARNHINDKDDNIKLIKEKVFTEYTVMIEELVSILESLGKRNICIVRYAEDYLHYIPEDLRRPLKGKDDKPNQRAKIYDTTIAIMADLRREMSVVHIGDRAVHMTIVTPFQLPMYRRIATSIHSLTNLHKTVLFTHNPLDMHITDHLKNVTLIESMTGRLRTVKDMGSKLWKLDSIPFNKYTHAVMGDKDFIIPSVQRATKKALIAVAETEGWAFKSANFMRRSMKKHGFEIKINLP